ncbi:GAF and ANTAR domain-containing protein [Microbacterium sp. zg.B48]|uniref:GAF and ANTAR domain-containing protein n=1 Tax=unclassified Microbacterium TaxID=2609290 RepID=UPI00214C3F4B|nr:MULTISPECIES: GAF and ANTAR domain-containing protein [unclassified Microbacterium]MCR2763137.1 GAF and ANTAR domain-containing protein [Microbacterium sp. zg.B48]MCR2808726.1 GAF and ANTAR domain-containing protein [Microbacterium sp. zg.B185]WIM18843.1 GAF and ANTAR domain-containing protein [Microbacterium sp. zg-B185]
MSDSFAAALEAIDRAQDQPEGFCAAFVQAFPVTGAAVSTMGDLLGSETVAASDRCAARIDEVQFDLGEGPCWDAVRTGTAVLQPDITATGPSLWPAFTAALRPEDISSLFAFPLLVGPLRFGAIDLYSRVPVALDGDQTKQAGAMAEMVGRHLLRRALTSIGEAPEGPGNAYSRRLIHQASGVVLAQTGLSADDARLVIQGQAFAASRAMMDVAQDVIDGRLRFAREGTRIEVVE